MKRNGNGKGGKRGHCGHNRDLIQTARELNKQADEDKVKKKAQKGKMVDNIKELWLLKSNDEK